MEFYSEGSLFYYHRDVVCLLEDCQKNHETIYKDLFVVNMHDVFDGTNPGRCRKKEEFFEQVRIAKIILGMKEPNLD